MGWLKKHWWWIAGIGIVLVGVGVTCLIVARRIVSGFEPMVRSQVVTYLSERFHSSVSLGALRISAPKMSVIRIIRRRGRGVKVPVEADDLSMRFLEDPSLPPMFSFRRLRFVIDLGTLLDASKTVDMVDIEDMQINVPPKRQRPRQNVASSSLLPGGQGTGVAPGGGSSPAVLIRNVRIRDAVLNILPNDPSKKSLVFQIGALRLTSTGTNTAMNYEADLTNPKPPGDIHSAGAFGPWQATEPGDTPLNGKYTFDHADLGVFNGIAGILNSTGTFAGTLDAVHAQGEADVQDFRLKMTGTPVPLHTQFEVLVDGTNGNTVLQPVHATLGRTSFTTTGAVVKQNGHLLRTIELGVKIPDGDIRDLLRLAAKGPPFMDGRITLNTKLLIPPLTGTVREKLQLDGTFALRDARFLRSTIQQQLDQLSRRAQGQPQNEGIDQVVANLRGAFRLDNQIMTFRSLSFGVPGADVDLSGQYDLSHETVDFHGALKLQAKVSETVTGWKRWALKPVDPFFAKHGAGTYLRIQVVGTSHQPKFGLDLRR
jgi:hypothetical protein